MSQQDARERAIKSFVEEQEWSYMAEMPRGIGESFGAGWDAAKREDEQRIAALVALARELFEGAESVDASYMALYVSPDLWGRWLAAIGLQECPTCHGCGGCGEHETDAPFGADPCPTCEGSGVRALAGSEESGSGAR